MRNLDEVVEGPAHTDRVPDRVDSIMRRSVVVLAPDQSIGEAARILEREGISGAPITEGGRIVGVVSLADLFRSAGVRPEDAATSGPWHRHETEMAQSGRTVGTAMRTNVATVPPEAPVGEVAALMRRRGVNRIPVVAPDGTVVGIVARDDIIEAVARTA